MKKTKIFITGDEGNIGYFLKSAYRNDNNFDIINDYSELQNYRTNVRYVVGTDYFIRESKELDILDTKVLDKVFSYNPDIVIHCAALVNTDKCEHFKENAIRVNIIGSYNIAKYASKISSYFVNFSTTATIDVNSYSKDSYFDESNRRFPSTVYGDTKLIAENIVKNTIDCNNLLNILPVFIFSIFPHDNSSQLVKIMRVLYLVSKGFDIELPVTLSLNNYKNYFYISDAIYTIKKLIDFKTIGDVIISNYPQEAKLFSQYFDLILSFFKLDRKSVSNYIKFDSDADYLHNHIASNKKLINIVGDYEITSIDKALKQVYHSVKEKR